MERLFLVTKYDEKGRRYICEVVKSRMYPSDKACESGVDVTEIPNGGQCHIYLTSGKLGWGTKEGEK